MSASSYKHIIKLIKPFKEEPTELGGFETVNIEQIMCQNTYYMHMQYLCLGCFLHSVPRHYHLRNPAYEYTCTYMYYGVNSTS